MSSSLKQYQSRFAAVVEQKQKLGLDEKSGLEGRLRNSVHAIEQRVEQLNEQGLLITMLMMRRHEKDFMLRRDRKYGDDISKRAGEFVAALDNTGAPEATRAELKQRLGDYQRDFAAWMETALTLTSEQKAMSEAFSAVEPVIEAVSKSVNETRADAERLNRIERENIQLWIQAAIVLIAAMVLGARLLHRPLGVKTAERHDVSHVGTGKGQFRHRAAGPWPAPTRSATSR